MNDEVPQKKSFYLPLIGVVVVLLGGITAWHFWMGPHPPIGGDSSKKDPKGTIQDVYNFDQFQEDLAARVRKQYGAGDGGDFDVAVASTPFPVGTLYRATAWVPADAEDCIPANPPQPYPAERLFPAYTLSSETVLTSNLGSHAIEGLDSAGANLRHAASVQYQITDVKVHLLDDKMVEQITSQGDCRKYIAAHPGVRLIRGFIEGKMTFTVKVDNPASVKAQLGKVGGFSVEDNPQSSTLSVSDNESQQIVQLLSEFRAQMGGSQELKPTAAAGPSAKPKPPLTGSAELTVMPAPAPPPPSGSGHGVQQSPMVGTAAPGPSATAPTMTIFVQEDTNDTPEAGTKAVALLRGGLPGALVVSKVERVGSDKMPGMAQVRFFNAGDEGLAKQCLAVFQKAYPTARVVRIGLPSPQGQLEVWLPKAVH